MIITAVAYWYLAEWKSPRDCGPDKSLQSSTYIIPSECINFKVEMSNAPLSPSEQFQQELDKISGAQRVDESVFLGLQVAGGQILLPCLLLTILFSRNVHRNPAFINFCCSWILSSIIYSLLVYRGRSDPVTSDPVHFIPKLTPSPGICLAQASLINDVQALTACTGLGIALQLFLTIISAMKGSAEQNAMKNRWSTLALLIAPCTIFVIFSLTSVVLGNREVMGDSGTPIFNSNLALPGTFYCTIIFPNKGLSSEFVLARAPFYFSLIMIILSLCLEASTAIVVLKHLRTFRKLLPTGWAYLLTRIVVFSLYRLGLLSLMFESPLIAHPLEFFLAGISTDPLYDGTIDLIQATVPLAVFLIFATEKDILIAWTNWRRESVISAHVMKDEGFGMKGAVSDSQS